MAQLDNKNILGHSNQQNTGSQKILKKPIHM